MRESVPYNTRWVIFHLTFLWGENILQTISQEGGDANNGLWVYRMDHVIKLERRNNKYEEN